MGPAAENGEFRERTYTSQDGLRLYFRDYGDPAAAAVPVLCLPGLTRNSKDFDGLARRLAQTRRVICPDYRGRGRSQYDDTWRRYVPRTYVDDLRHLLAAANLHRVVVVGTSLGGILAAALAVAMPCAVAAAVLNDVGPDIESDGLERIIAYMRSVPSMPDWQSAADYLRRALPDLPASTDHGWLDIARATFREGEDGTLHVDWDPALVKPLLAARGEDMDLWPLFRALSGVPVVAVRGARSDLLSQATLQRMADEIPGLVTVTVAGVGHAPSLLEPEVREAFDALFTRI